MPKMKTKSSAKKRFKLTGSGKIKRKRLTKSGLVADADVANIKKQLGMK
jgi:large subunit ribosomal protein L35